MKKKQLVFRPTGEVRVPRHSEYYLYNEQLLQSTGNLLAKYPIYSAVEEVIDVPLWMASDEMFYYSIDRCGNIDTITEYCRRNNTDDWVYGNYFEDEDECKKYRDTIQFILTERLLDNPEFSTMIEKLKGELA